MSDAAVQQIVVVAIVVIALSWIAWKVATEGVGVLIQALKTAAAFAGLIAIAAGVLVSLDYINQSDRGDLVLVAIGHIVGAAIAYCLVSAGLMLCGTWLRERHKQDLFVEAAFTLDVSVHDLRDPDECLDRAFVRYLRARYASELLPNRLSDFLGPLVTLWGWIVSLVQIGIFVGAAWSVLSGDLPMAAIAWAAPVVQIAGSLVTLCASGLCKLITGRYAGEAKRMRKALAESRPRDSYAAL